MRQRMDESGDSMQDMLRQTSVDLFKKFGIEPSALENGYVPVDIDVSPFLGEECSKEGISIIPRDTEKPADMRRKNYKEMVK